jgi:hypothetical protein
MQFFSRVRAFGHKYGTGVETEIKIETKEKTSGGEFIANGGKAPYGPPSRGLP